MIDLILYAHVPFCSSKCHFCGWVADIPTQELVRSQEHYPQYTRAVKRQMEYYAEKVKDHAVQTKSIYFGGGTPTTLSVQELEQLLGTLLQEFKKSPDFEDSTIEISPETASFEKLKGLKQIGFDRISMGAQSFNNDRLRSLARAHTRETVISTFKDARRAGFDNINIDLMFALPDETFEEWKETFEIGLSLEPDHFAVYVYYPMPGTVLAANLNNGLYKQISSTEAAERYYWAAERLAAKGYQEYMFQLFEKDGKRCNCDTGYFQLQQEWLGFGAGAQSLYGQRLFGGQSDLKTYLADPIKPAYFGPAREDKNELARKVFQMLHTCRGVNYETFKRRMGIDFKKACEAVPIIARYYNELKSREMIEETEAGFWFKDLQSRALWFCEQRQAPNTATSGDSTALSDSAPVGVGFQMIV